LLLEEVEEGGFFGLEGRGVGLVVLEEGGHGVGEVGVEDSGVDVALAADGGGVTEVAGDGLDGGDDVALELGL
jgi:hypothetical protein